MLYLITKFLISEEMFGSEVSKGPYSKKLLDYFLFISYYTQCFNQVCIFCQIISDNLNNF